MSIDLGTGILTSFDDRRVDDGGFYGRLDWNSKGPTFLSLGASGEYRLQLLKTKYESELLTYRAALRLGGIFGYMWEWEHEKGQMARFSMGCMMETGPEFAKLIQKDRNWKFGLLTWWAHRVGPIFRVSVDGSWGFSVAAVMDSNTDIFDPAIKRFGTLVGLTYGLTK